MYHRIVLDRSIRGAKISCTVFTAPSSNHCIISSKISKTVERARQSSLPRNFRRTRHTTIPYSRECATTYATVLPTPS